MTIQCLYFGNTKHVCLEIVQDLTQVALLQFQLTEPRENF
jgi:hypothetical protein